MSFDTIVIDEAAQASEPDIVLPASGASCRVIVVGDHKQLGWVIVHPVLLFCMCGRLYSNKTLNSGASDASAKMVEARSYIEIDMSAALARTSGHGEQLMCTLRERFGNSIS